MSNDQQALTNDIAGLYAQWIRALQVKDYSWFEKHMAEDLSISTHPVPGLAVSKAQFIEGEKMIESLKAETLAVHAHVVNQIVVSIWVVRIDEEKVNANIRDVYGPTFPVPDEFSALTKNKTMAYIDAWRKNGDIWQCFDHHMIGPSN
jgi:hypothetical protein